MECVPSAGEGGEECGVYRGVRMVLAASWIPLANSPRLFVHGGVCLGEFGWGREGRGGVGVCGVFVAAGMV